MTLSNPSTFGCPPASTQAGDATDVTGTPLWSDSGAQETGWGLSALSRAAVNAACRTTRDLGYGCVDWYIYVGEAASLAPVVIAE